MPYGHIYRYAKRQTRRHCWSVRSMCADELSDASLDTVMQAALPFSLVHLHGLGGGAGAADRDHAIAGREMLVALRQTRRGRQSVKQQQAHLAVAP